MLAKILNSYYTHTRALTTAIDKKNETNFKAIIQVASNLNKPLFETVTPLEHCLNGDLYNFAFCLLETYHVNPNITTIDSDKIKLPLIRYFLEKHQLDAAKLLVLYGATLSEDTFKSHPNKSLAHAILNEPNTKIILKEYKAIHEKEIKGEHSNTELSATWQRLSDRESNEQLKICYKQKADVYLNEEKIQTSRASSSSINTTKKGSPSTSKVFDSSVGNPYTKFSPPKDTLTQPLLSDQQNINAGNLPNSQDNINNVTSKP